MCHSLLFPVSFALVKTGLERKERGVGSHVRTGRVSLLEQSFVTSCMVLMRSSTCGGAWSRLTLLDALRCASVLSLHAQFTWVYRCSERPVGILRGVCDSRNV